MSEHDYAFRATGEIANGNGDARYTDNETKALVHAINGITYAILDLAEATREAGVSR